MSSNPTSIATAAALMNQAVEPFRSTSPASSVSSSSASSSGLYIPLHKRQRSMSSTDDSLSSRSSSPSRPSSRTESSYTGSEPDHTYIYSRERLMALAKSPLAVMSKEAKDKLRERTPEVVLSRRHRKAMEFRARQQVQQSKTAEHPQQPDQPHHQLHPQHQPQQKQQKQRQQVSDLKPVKELLPVQVGPHLRPEVDRRVVVQPQAHYFHHHARASHQYQQKRSNVNARQAVVDRSWRRPAAVATAV